MRLTYILIFWWVQSYDPFLDYRKHKPPHLLRSHLNSVQPPASRHHWDSRCRWALWFVDPTTHVSQPILPIHHRPTKINPKPILFCFEQKRKKKFIKVQQWSSALLMIHHKNHHRPRKMNPKFRRGYNKGCTNDHEDFDRSATKGSVEDFDSIVSESFWAGLVFADFTERHFLLLVVEL